MPCPVPDHESSHTRNQIKKTRLGYRTFCRVGCGCRCNEPTRGPWPERCLGVVSPRFDDGLRLGEPGA